MRSLPDLPVFTTADAAALGWTSEALKHATRTHRLTRLRRGAYTAVADPGPIEHALAAARLSTGAVITHRSAVLLHSLPLLGAAPLRPELTVQPSGTTADSLSHVYRAAMPATDVQFIHGARCSSAARTFVDVARHQSLVTAVAVGDAALRSGVTPEEIDAVLRRCWNWPGIGHAQRAARLLDGRSESALESLSRCAIDAERLPAPALQQPIHNSWNGFVARVDFYWDEFGVVGEADGATKYVDRATLIEEKRRQERLEDLGLVVVRWGWSDAERAPATLAARLRTAFERGSARDRSGFPRQWVLGRPSDPSYR